MTERILQERETCVSSELAMMSWMIDIALAKQNSSKSYRPLAKYVKHLTSCLKFTFTIAFSDEFFYFEILVRLFPHICFSVVK